MATGMKLWIALVAVGSLGIAVWQLPPSAPEPASRGEASPEETRARELLRDVRRTHDVLQRTRWADSLTDLTLAPSERELSTGAAPRLERDGVLDSVRVRVREELQRAGVREAKAKLGFFVQPRDHGQAMEVRPDNRQGLETYLGQVDGRPYCYRVLVTSSPVSPSHSSIRRYSWTEDAKFSNVLGGCRMLAQYGLPGRHVLSWLERGALDFAKEPAYGARRILMTRGPRVASPFGRTVPFWAASLDLDRCLAGIASACERVVLDPLGRGELEADVLYVVQNSPVSAIGAGVMGSPFSSVDDYLLADLAVEFGEDRFTAFWTSDRSVSEAFEAAFGLPLGAWIVTWTESHFPRTRPGPRLSKKEASSTLLLMTLCLLASGLWARRRRVA